MTDWLDEIEDEDEIPNIISPGACAVIDDKLAFGARMKISRAKELFEYGVLKKAVATKAPMEDGWILLIDDQPLKTDRGPDRIFKTLDATHKASKAIGFQSMSVEG